MNGELFPTTDTQLTDVSTYLLKQMKWAYKKLFSASSLGALFKIRRAKSNK